MAGTLPTTPTFQTLNMQNWTETIETVADSGRSQRKTNGLQYWKFTASYEPGTRKTFAPLMAFIAKQRGRFEAFTAKLPEYSDTSGSLNKATQTLLVNNASGYTAGARTIAVDVSPGINITGALKAGDFINFSGHNKVYMVTSDLDIDGSGEGSFTIEPGLVASVVDDETVVYGDVQFTVRLNSDIQEFRAANGDQVRYEIDLTEDI